MFRTQSRLLAAGLVLVFASVLLSCVSGGNSTDTAEVYAVTVSDNGSLATMEVFFSLSDNGTPVSGVSASSIRFTVAKLIPGSSPSSWQSYINTIEVKSAGEPGTTPDGAAAVQATSERASTSGGVFTDNGDGTYSYKFSFNFRAVTSPVGVAWQPSLTHRIAMQVSDNATNATYDFVPTNQALTPETRSIVANSSCSECHEKFGFHGGDRVSVDYCVTCHNPGSEDANSGNTVDFKVMVHKIHRGQDLPVVQAGGEYAIWGFNNAKHNYSTAVYPQDIRNCTKCHTSADASTPEGDNWKNEPSTAACTSCHDAPDPAVYPTFPNMTAAEIEAVHVVSSEVAATMFQFNILSIANTAPGQFPVITFSVTDPTNGDMPYDIFTDPAFTAGSASSLSLLIGWNSTEYTNTGSGDDPAQPVSINTLSAGVSTDNGNGTYTATSTVAIPGTVTGSGVVALQGHPAADFDGDGVYTDRAPATSVVRYFAITDAAAQSRRQVVSTSKCNSCHALLSAHGSNRNNETQVCVICHNPNATDISVRPGAPATGVDGKVEEAIDFKYMIHAIHAGALAEEGFRENGIVVYGFRGSVNDFSEVWLPSGTDSLKDCTRCHISAPAVPISTAALPTTVLTGSDLSSPADDENITPTAAVCSSCHDTELDTAHMQQNGGVFDLTDGTSYTETCSLCHGTGKIKDVAVAHAAETFTLIGTITAPTSSSTGGSSQVALCGPGPVSSQPAGHTDRVDCCSCHSFN